MLTVLSFIFLHTARESVSEKLFVGRTKATAVTNPDNSSTAKRIFYIRLFRLTPVWLPCERTARTITSGYPLARGECRLQTGNAALVRDGHPNRNRETCPSHPTSPNPLSNPPGVGSHRRLHGNTVLHQTLWTWLYSSISAHAALPVHLNLLVRK